MFIYDIICVFKKILLKSAPNETAAAREAEKRGQPPLKEYGGENRGHCVFGSQELQGNLFDGIFLSLFLYHSCSLFKKKKTLIITINYEGCVILILHRKIQVSESSCSLAQGHTLVRGQGRDWDSPRLAGQTVVPLPGSQGLK